MKHLTLSLVAMAIGIFNDGYAFGQSPQGSNGDQGSLNSDGTCQPTSYYPTQWNPCEDSHGSGCESLWTRPLFGHGWMARCRATKAFPDAGWNAPAHMPVNYDGAWYGSYLPQHAYGTPGGGFIANYPTVYQPTDTTQLGYYYQKVPTWQSRSDMIPGVPNPRNFHARVCPQGGPGGHGYHGASYGANSASCQNYSNVQYSATPQNATSVTPQNSTLRSPQVVRTAQPQRHGVFSGVRLSSMTELFDR